MGLVMQRAALLDFGPQAINVFCFGVLYSTFYIMGHSLYLLMTNNLYGGAMLEISAIEKLRKRHFAFLCVGFCLPVLIGFTIVDLFEGDGIEALINVFMAIVLVFGFIAITRWEADLLVYRLTLSMLSLIFIYNIGVGSGNGTALYWLFVFPLVFVFFLGKKEGRLFAFIFFSVLCLVLINPFSLNVYPYQLGVSLRFLVSLLLVSIIAYSLEVSREKYGSLLLSEHNQLQVEKRYLESALGKIKTLHGLIPICSHCKKIRDDKGSWQQVEAYVKDHSDAEFSHGICPNCLDQFYPDE